MLNNLFNTIDFRRKSFKRSLTKHQKSIFLAFLTFEPTQEFSFHRKHCHEGNGYSKRERKLCKFVHYVRIFSLLEFLRTFPLSFVICFVGLTGTRLCRSQIVTTSFRGPGPFLLYLFSQPVLNFSSLTRWHISKPQVVGKQIYRYFSQSR